MPRLKDARAEGAEYWLCDLKEAEGELPLEQLSGSCRCC